MSEKEQDVNIESNVSVGEQRGGQATGVRIDHARDVTIIQRSGQAEAEKPLQPFEPEMVAIPAGSFSMGDDEDPPAAPRHAVDLPAYRIGRRPVTNAQYHHYLHRTGQSADPELRWENGTTPSPEQEEQPVSGVTWHEALAYCAWLAEETGRAYTLPSEAQWERAAWEEGESSVEAGGIREWTTTLWGEKRRTPDEDYRYPWQPDDGRDDLLANDQVRRVTRGSTSRLTKRTSELPRRRGFSDERIGFRVAINEEA